MPFLSANVLLDVLNFLSRDQLEKLHIVCRLLKSLILNHFKERPLRLISRHHLNIHMASEGVLLFFYKIDRKRMYDSHKDARLAFDPSTGQWLIGTAPSPITSKWMTLLGPKHLRVGTTKVHLGETPYNIEAVTQLHSLSHLWTGRELGLVQNWYIKDIVGISLEAVLSDQQLISCRLLSLDVKLELALYHFKGLYNPVVVEWVRGYTRPKEFQTIVDVVEHQVDNSNSKTIFVFPLSIYPDTLLELAKESFVQATRPSPSAC